MVATTADGHKERFIKLLHELFQLDKPELDFGLYRIMHAKSDQLSRFIREDLAQAIEDAFAKQGEQQLSAMRHDIDEKRKQAEELGAPDPDSAPAVKQARAAYHVAKQEQSASVDIYDHLYRFFSRYYDKGDFMSRRHHVAENDSRAAPYAVPYDGREVYLHWANKDQYYVKSSETLANFTFNLNEALKTLQGSAAQTGLAFDSTDAALKVHCRVVDATEGEHNDVKESTERFFIIHHDEPIRLDGADLVLQFEYRPDPEKTGQSGVWQKKRLVEAEERIMEALRATDGVVAYRENLATRAPTDKQKERTLLGKYLQQYTARNTMDYFIHKDLGGFLSRELDFYIKNEILRLDDIDDADVLIVEQQLKKIQVLRKLAKEVIDFLAQLENFQKKLWLKKKFITEVGYCFTLDLMEANIDLASMALSNPRQRSEWEKLYCLDIGMLERDIKSLGVYEVIKSKKYCHLMVDTNNFDFQFFYDISSLLESPGSNLDGLVVNGENYQALQAFKNKFEGEFDSVYIDPPYNTDAGPINYKNGYRNSSWVSLLQDRLFVSKTLMKEDAINCVTIDDYQVNELSMVLDSVYGGDAHLGTAVIRNNPSGRSTVSGFSICHEYAIFHSNSDGARLSRLPRNEKQLSRFTVEEGKYVDWRNFRKDGGAVTHRKERPKQFYPIYVNPEKMTLRIPDLQWDSASKSWIELESLGDNEVKVFPIDDNGKERVWSLYHISAKEKIFDLEVALTKAGNIKIMRRHEPDSGVLPRTWWDDKLYAAREYGSATLRNMFSVAEFSFAKSPHAVKDCLWISGADKKNAHVLDYFSGSGTTGHAVINLNRQDSGSRKYCLVEVGDYFESVLKSRLKKAAYSEKWKDGHPQESTSGGYLGLSHAFKYFCLESYDDALNNLELDDNPQRDALVEQNSDLRRNYTLKYLLDVETRGSASLLNTEWFRDPESYMLKVKQPGSDESRKTAVDLVETFNWLIGLHVSHLDKPRTYVARFEREADPELPEDQNTRLKAVTLRENEDGAYWIRQVEGLVRRIPGSDEDLAKVLVVWRKLTDDAEKDAAVLEALLEKYKIGTTDSEFDTIYINGPHGLNLTGRARDRVHSLEETFHARMWEGCDDDI
ncbi:MULTISPECIES: site-specific DNA-methyltransferase [unclassified Halomonas]|uniref:site-specific DNA-methyltransferase n=1 Tax=unclassified Halomonas TaxID=2609666 RepID=UPI0040341C85